MKGNRKVVIISGQTSAIQRASDELGEEVQLVQCKSFADAEKQLEAMENVSLFIIDACATHRYGKARQKLVELAENKKIPVLSLQDGGCDSDCLGIFRQMNPDTVRPRHSGYWFELTEELAAYFKIETVAA